MAQVRPKILLRKGRINQPITIPLNDLLTEQAKTTLSAAVAAGATSLPVVDADSFFEVPFSSSAGTACVLGTPGTPTAEIIFFTSVTNNTELAIQGCEFSHPAGEPIWWVRFSDFEISWAATTQGSKSTIFEDFIEAGLPNIEYNETTKSSGYYFARFLALGYGYLVSVSVNTAGTGYHVGDTVTITGDQSTATLTVDSVDGGGGITGISITDPGLDGFAQNNDYGVSGGHGTNAVLNVDSAEFDSPYSDPAPYSGYTQFSARSIIQSAISGLNKDASKTKTLDDSFLFGELDNFQTEVLREQKRWSFMQAFDVSLGNAVEGDFRVALPDDMDDIYTNKTAWHFRIGNRQNGTYIDKSKWDELTFNISFGVLNTTFVAGAASITLVDSSDFDDSGTIRIQGSTYDYTANNRTTGVLTLKSVTTDGQTAGAYVTQGGGTGEMEYWTIFEGFIYFWPFIPASLVGRNYFSDYYKKQTLIVRDSDNIVVPDQTGAVYFLQWKSIVKMNNGDETPASQAKMNLYIDRREKMKQKDSLGRTFRLRPLKNSVASSSGLGNDDPAYVRAGNFPNS